ncbi:MAG: ribosome rescue protein RqcH [Candidatus Verstraetearchaeota archaeon]|nr:ribosome rescue protein RqcH [Candidatus Verstraetearchaeota archaeon]
MKLGLTSLDILAIVRELNSTLISARIENLYQVEGGVFLLRLHTRSSQADLAFEPGKRANLTSYRFTIPERPSPLVMHLRRFLVGFKVDRIEQYDFDRIISVDITRGEEGYTVYLELFGEGNLVIADREGTIRFVLRPKEMRDRVLKPGEQYLPPPKRGVEISSGAVPPGALSTSHAASRSLTHVFNLPAELVEEALMRAGIPPQAPSSSLTEQNLAEFRNAALLILEEVRSGKLKPVIVERDGTPVSVLPVEFSTILGERRYFQTFNEAVDVYFSNIVIEQTGDKRRARVEGEISALESIREKQLAHIGELESRRTQSLAVGKLILSNLGSVQSSIEAVLQERRSGRRWEDILSLDHRIKSIDGDRGTMVYSLGGADVEIDFKMSAARNAERYFSEAKEAAKKLEGLKNALKETELKIEEARRGLSRIEEPKLLRSMKKDWYEKFRWMRSSDGFLLLGGKDASQNEVLVKRHLGSRDLFVHADLPGGSVVIVKSEGREIPERTKEEAVAFAVAYSRAWKAGIGVADGYWVPQEQVSKSPPSGEYLGKGAFMVYGERNYVRNVPLRLHLGVLLSNDEYKVIVGVGMGDSVPSKTSLYVTLRPGGLEGKKLVTAIKERLAQAAGEGNGAKIRAIPDGDLLNLLPPGGAEVD